MQAKLTRDQFLGLLVVLTLMMSIGFIDTVSASEPEPSSGQGSIVAHKFHDANSNKVQDDTEENLAGWPIRVYAWTDSLTLIAEGETNEAGNMTISDLAPGRYKVWEADKACWTITTPATAWNGGYYQTVYVEEDETVTAKFGNRYTCPPAPETCIDLEKTGPETAQPGETITYHFWVHNCGEVALEGGAQVYDSLFGEAPIWDGDIQPDEIVEFDKTYTLPDDHCGDFTNDAWAIGHPHGYPDVRDDDSWTVSILCEPQASIDLEKYVSVDDQANWQDADTPTGPEVEAGHDVYFRFVVTNDGDATLTNVTLADSDFDVSDCTLTDPLDPDDSFACVIGPFAAQEGQHTNLGTATGDYNSKTYEGTDPAHYYGTVLPTPSIDVEKYVSTSDDGSWIDADTPTGPEVEAGHDVYFRFVVTNDGDATLTNVTLADSDFDVSDCTLTDPLDPDDSFACVIGPFAAQEGQHTNTATATGDYDGQTYTDQDDANYNGTVPDTTTLDVWKDATTLWERTYDWTIDKTVEPDALELALGESGDVTYTIEVDRIVASDIHIVSGTIEAENDGATTAYLTEVVDCIEYQDSENGNAFTELTCETLQTGGTIAQDATETWDYNITFTPVDEATAYRNVAYVTLSNHADGEHTYTYDVPFDLPSAPTSEVDECAVVSDALYSDDLPEGFSMQRGYDGSWPTCESQTYEFGTTFTNESAEPGSYDVVNTAAVQEEDTVTIHEDEATVTITVPGEPALDIEVEKTADPTSVVEPGGTVVFTVRVTNTSDVPVTLTSLVDDIYGDLDSEVHLESTCDLPSDTLADGDTYVCTFSEMVEGSAGDVETDTVTATAEDDEGNEVTDSDDATVTIIPGSAPEPCIDLTKTIDGPYRTADDLFLTDKIIPVAVEIENNPNDYGGENYFYFLVEIEVENCGGTELSGVEVVDNFSNEAQPFETDDPDNVIITPPPDPTNGMVHETLTWTVGTIPSGESRTLQVKVGTESNPNQLLEPTSAPQTIFYNGRDEENGATVTADGGLSASVGAIAIEIGEEILCEGSDGEWDDLVRTAGSNTFLHDKCGEVVTELPIELTPAAQNARFQVFLPLVLKPTR
jgi:uncharacterized repeat protein (TIGR01451 family)